MASEPCKKEKKSLPGILLQCLTFCTNPLSGGTRVPVMDCERCSYTILPDNTTEVRCHKCRKVGPARKYGVGGTRVSKKYKKNCSCIKDGGTCPRKQKGTMFGKRGFFGGNRAGCETEQALQRQGSIGSVKREGSIGSSKREGSIRSQKQEYVIPLKREGSTGSCKRVGSKESFRRKKNICASVPRRQEGTTLSPRRDRSTASCRKEGSTAKMKKCSKREGSTGSFKREGSTGSCKREGSIRSTGSCKKQVVCPGNRKQEGVIIGRREGSSEDFKRPEGSTSAVGCLGPRKREGSVVSCKRSQEGLLMNEGSLERRSSGKRQSWKKADLDKCQDDADKRRIQKELSTGSLKKKSKCSLSRAKKEKVIEKYPKPKAPLRTSNITPISVDLDWMSPFCATPVKYQIDKQLLPDGEWCKVADYPADSDELKFTVKDLTPERKYNFRVSSVYDDCTFSEPLYADEPVTTLPVDVVPELVAASSQPRQWSQTSVKAKKKKCKEKEKKPKSKRRRRRSKSKSKDRKKCKEKKPKSKERKKCKEGKSKSRERKCRQKRKVNRSESRASFKSEQCKTAKKLSKAPRRAK